MLSCFLVSEEPEKTQTFLMHHNAFELGTDRFDEALIIKDQILEYLKGNLAFEALPKFVREKLDLRAIARIGKERLIQQIEERFASPKIGERVNLAL